MSKSSDATVLCVRTVMNSKFSLFHSILSDVRGEGGLRAADLRGVQQSGKSHRLVVLKTQHLIHIISQQTKRRYTN